MTKALLPQRGPLQSPIVLDFLRSVYLDDHLIYRKLGAPILKKLFGIGVEFETSTTLKISLQKTSIFVISNLSFLSKPLKEIPVWNIFQDQQDRFRSDPVAKHAQNISVRANLLHEINFL